MSELVPYLERLGIGQYTYIDIPGEGKGRVPSPENKIALGKELPWLDPIWYPEGDGPFPLVLIVHGNHAMSDYSDPGYAYLGEHLASQGYIAVSVDENFLNGLFFFDGEFEEMPLRAWILLKHLQQWQGWNETPH